MIISRENAKANISTNVRAVTGTIAMNPEMFDLIIKGIYDDEILASVREPLFNAVDAHTYVNKRDVALILHSPTDLEPYYSVRDFGPGMSQEMVETTFMTIGESTKRQDNSMVGAKGVGSKAPLSTTDMFTVVSIVDGVRSVYSVYMDEGLPNVSMLSSQETDEGNGVEIKFAVDPSEIHKFRTALVKCLRYATFPYEVNDPFIRAEIEEKKFPVQYTYEEDGWILNMYSPAARNRDSVVIMGQQPYRSRTIEAKREWPLITVSIPIGDCDVNPGREWTIEGRGDRGFGEKLEAFITRGMDKRKGEITAQLKKLKHISEYKAAISALGGYFANQCGAPFLRQKWKDAIGADTIDDCEIFSGPGSKRKSGNYGYAEVMNGMPIALLDEDKNIRAKCNYLSEKTGKSVYTGGYLVRKLMASEFFSGTVHRISEMEKRPRVSRGGYGSADYVPGHRVGFMNANGNLTFPRVSKVDFKDFDNVMFFSGGSIKGQCALGWMKDVKDQSPEFMETIDCKEGLWLVPETRSKWLSEDCQVVGKDEIRALVQKELLPYWMSREWSRNKEYVAAIEEVRHLGVDVKPLVWCPKIRVDMQTVASQLDIPYHNTKYVADRELDRRARIARKYVGKVVERYPVLKYTGMENFNKPEIVAYRRMIDNGGE